MRTIPSDDLRKNLLVTILKQRDSEEMVFPDGGVLVQKAHPHPASGLVLQIIAVDLPYIIVRPMDNDPGVHEKVRATLDTRDLAFGAVSLEYANALLPNIKNLDKFFSPQEPNNE